MKKKKYLPLYYKWMENGLTGDSGLCKEFMINGFDYDVLDKEFLTRKESIAYSDRYLEKRGIFTRGIFTPLRQNIVLLMAAMNNEL